MRHLAYGRIILNAAAPAESFSTGERETGLIVLSGNATVTDDRGQRGITGTERRDLHSTRFFSESLGKLHMLLAKNVEAGRLVAGFTISEPGDWTSWPPHEHAKML